MELGKVVPEMFTLMGVADPQGKYEEILTAAKKELAPRFKSSFVYRGGRDWTSEVAQVTPETLASDIEADMLEHQLRTQCNDCNLRGECEQTTEDFVECHRDGLALHWAQGLESQVIQMALEVRGPSMDADEACRRAAEAAIWPFGEPETEVAT